MLILIADSFSSDLPQTLSKFGEVTDDLGRLGETEILLIRSKTKVTRELIDRAPCLKLILRGGVGLDNVDIVYATGKGIKVTNTAEASTVAVAELAFALMIALPNKIVRAHTSMTEGKWLKKELSRTELFGKTLGILGFGRIGSALAIRANSFRMRVLGWHPDAPFSHFAEIRPTWEEVVGESDFVSLHMPLVAATRSIINRSSLARFKKGAYLINTGRAKCVVEEDIVEALKSGRLAGFATDVWCQDPPENSPLMDAPNCIFSPHIGASSKENMIRIGQMVETIIEDHCQNSPSSG